MPIYIYQHPKTKKIVEVVQKVNDEHVYIDEKGAKWDRVFTVPNVAVDSVSNMDPNDARKFVELTGKKKGTIGGLMDLSKELSERRGGEEHDPIIRKRNEDYKKQTGVDHPSVKKLEAKKKLSKMGISVSN